MKWLILLLLADAVAAEPRTYAVDPRGGSFDARIPTIAWRAPGGHCGGDVVHELERFVATLKSVVIDGPDVVAIRAKERQPAARTLHGDGVDYGFWDIETSTLVIRLGTTGEVQISLIHRTGLSQRERLDACYERWIGRAK